METFLAFAKMMILLGVVIYLISLSMKFLNRYANQTTQGIVIIQKVGVTKNSSIGVVQIAGNYYVMSFSETQNQIMKELTADEVNIYLQSLQVTKGTGENIPDFGKILKETSEKLFKKRPKNEK